MQEDILINVKDVCELLQCSSATLGRRVAEARKGAAKFPLPVNGYKRKALWYRPAIERFLMEMSFPDDTVPAIKSGQSKVRAVVVAKGLEEFGIKTRHSKKPTSATKGKVK